MKLRRLYDTVEIHHRGLKALGVDEATYSTIVVPSILEKIPEGVRLSITRGKSYSTWNLDEMLKLLLEEIELREDQMTAHVYAKEDKEQRVEEKRSEKSGTANTFATATKGKDEKCAFCLETHKHEECTKVTSINKRKELIRKYGSCFTCLEKGHLSKNCNSNYSCNKNCKNKQHVSICEAKSQGPQNGVMSDNALNDGNILGNDVTRNTSNHHVGSNCRVALQTAQAIIRGKRGVNVRVLFDSGSHRSFISERAASQAGLQSIRKEWIEISPFGQAVKDRGLKEVFKIDVMPIVGGNQVSMEAYAVPSISQIKNEHVEVRKKEYSHLKGLWFSDVCRDEEVLDIDLLVGADYLWLFQGGRTIRGEHGDPVAVETTLGWVLSGPMRAEGYDSQVSMNLVTESVESKPNVERLTQKLWDFETLGIRPQDEVHEALKDCISFNGTRYQVRLPWKEGLGALPSNYANSLKRLKGQVRKLRAEPEILHEYNNIIGEQLDKGVIEPVIDLEATERVHYLPHHAVVRQDAKTTKVRVVYDASSKESKKAVSLNDCLHVGPPLSPLLYDILLRLRQKKIALISDIEKAFLNIEIARQDRDCLRFLWVQDVDSDVVNPVAYRFCRVVFGLNCSPFLLNATLQYHLDSFVEIDSEFVRVMKDSFYVDDLASGDHTEEDTFQLYLKAKSRLSSGGFNPRKWLTNNAKLRERISRNELEIVGQESKVDDLTYAKVVLGEKDGGTLEKVLGLAWNCEMDTFHFNLRKLADRAHGKAVTKRNILSVLAAVYDPLGLISPIVVVMKLIFQQLCVERVEWDEEVSGKRQKEWNDCVESVAVVEEIKVPRCVYGVYEATKSCSLHGFADASIKAYCAVVYFVCELVGSFSVELLTSKTRVAPLKMQTIPRLELMSGRILARSLDTVKNALEREVDIKEIVLWLDSKTALHWINNAGEWKQFVGHRVNEILQLTKKAQWRHCPGESNPADLGSRGVSAEILKASNMWWKGPQWLSGPREGWPGMVDIVRTEESVKEVKTTSALANKVEKNSGLENVIELGRFSKLDKLFRVVAYVKRFVKNLKAKVCREPLNLGDLQPHEIGLAEVALVQAAQAVLRSQRNYQQLVKSFGLVEDKGMLKCSSRLNNSELEIESVYPVILPKEHRLTELIIESCHRRVHHSGLRSTLAELRRRYWVPKGRQVVKKVVGRCRVCKRFQGKCYGEPPMASLPAFRVREAPAFSKSGVDFAGHLFVKNKKNGNEKAYIVLWSCCVTRAVTLDLVSDLNTSTFLRALRRFSARRGTPSLIVSDNAKTFKAAHKYVEKYLTDPDVRSHLEVNRIEWRFNLARAPWWGGFFERMVGTVKRCLKKVLGNARLTFDELVTVLLEIEQTVNGRPLTYEYDEVGGEMLTPAHLIHGRRLVSVPDEVKDEDSDSETESKLLKRFRYLTRKKKHYWNRWSREYLVDLREYHKVSIKKNEPKVKVGDVVLVEEGNKKRGQWKTGVVEQLIIGQDKEVRGATVRLMTKGKPVALNRSVRKLYPLEINSNVEGSLSEVEDREIVDDVDTEDDEGLEKEINVDVAEPEGRGPRVRRAAAVDSQWKTRFMLDP